VWPIETKFLMSGLSASDANSISQAIDTTLRWRAHWSAAANRHRHGTNRKPTSVARRMSACASVGSTSGPHITGPYGSVAGHGT
jgi:hypothetical protein